MGWEDNAVFYFVFASLTFFVWMDMSFFGEMQEQGLIANSTEAKAANSRFPVKSVKLRMQDHISHYVWLPLSEHVDAKYKISKLSWVSPNLISGLHLIVAIISGRLMYERNIWIRRLGCIVFEFRCFLDVFDGVVYRAQSNMKTSFVNGWGTYGYFIDAAADFIGCILVLVSCILYFLRCPPVKRKEYPNDDAEMALMIDYYGKSNSQYKEKVIVFYESKKKILIMMLAYGIQISARSGFWDHFLHEYHTLLEVKSDAISPVLQAEALSFHSTWAVLWLWKLCAADIFLELTIVAIFFDKFWRWVVLVNYVGPATLAITVVLSQMHVIMVRQYLGV
ncbi:ceramide phosphoethanolamine synthase-like [Dendronephthya gigantea]|uniref:ceramide phosphoethanolamine synthase-like n=1 Tax=Dendronephthya gigantea TaxID=151771 RepID=UPI00106DAC89|nr:ceramide phosphoethanolamine synthase-like [Dendronephthya gigantea]